MALPLARVREAQSKAEKAEHDLAPRASFPLTKDRNRIDVARLQDKGKDQLRQLLRDPELPTQLGIAALPATATAGAAAVASPAGFPPDLAGVVFDAINMVVRAKFEHFGDHAQRLGISADQKDKGAPIVAALIDKYIPNSLNRYELEMNAILWSLGVIAGNLAIVRALNEQARTATARPTLVRDDPTDARSM